jgi:hypothetical protein
MLSIFRPRLSGKKLAIGFLVIIFPCTIPCRKQGEDANGKKKQNDSCSNSFLISFIPLLLSGAAPKQPRRKEKESYGYFYF